MNVYYAKKNAEFIFYVGLVSQADTKLLIASPTLSAGDFKVSIDGAAVANPATLPTNTPAASSQVKITLSAAEMNGDNIIVTAIDAAGTEWCSDLFHIITKPQEANLVQVDGTVNASATLNLTKINVVNSGGDAIVATSSGSNGRGIIATGNGTGSGAIFQGGATGNGVLAQAGATSGSGIIGYGGAGTGNGIVGQGSVSGGTGIYGLASGNNPGITAVGAGSGSGITATGGTTGHGINGIGGATSGSGILGNAQTSGNGIYGIGTGSGNSGFIGVGGTNGSGALFQGNGSGQGLIAQGGLTGNGINGVGGATSGAGMYVNAVGSGAGLTAIGVGTVSVLATQGFSGPFDTSEKVSIADTLLKRDMSAVTGEASRSPLNCFRALRNKWSFSGNTWTCTKEDNTTAAWTATVTTNASAEPVISFTGA